MPTLIGDLIPAVRTRLIEPEPNFWTDAELLELIIKGAKDLWRAIVDLKQEHYIKIDNEHVSLEASTGHLTGVPSDVHKVYMIEPRSVTDSGANRGLFFKPLAYNDPSFQQSRTVAPFDPSAGCIYYDVFQAGAPVGSPEIVIAPQVTSSVPLSFVYVPTLPTLGVSSKLPIPGEADNAVIAWTVGYARAKEREDRSPDPAWMGVYSTEKQALLQSLGIRQYQEAEVVDAMFNQYWG